MMKFELRRGEISLQVSVHALGDDLCVMMTGGRAHIGAVCLSIARRSLNGGDRVGASTSVLAVTGHKDDVVAKCLSESLAAKLGRKVVAVCGIHYDGLAPDGIRTVLSLAGEAVRRICSRFESDRI